MDLSPLIWNSQSIEWSPWNRRPTRGPAASHGGRGQGAGPPAAHAHPPALPRPGADQQAAGRAARQGPGHGPAPRPHPGRHRLPRPRARSARARRARSRSPTGPPASPGPSAWTESPSTEAIASQAMLEAFQAELDEAGPDAAAGFNRLALTLNKASQRGAPVRVLAILDEYVDRPPDPDGEPLGLFFAMHRRPSRVGSGPRGVSSRVIRAACAPGAARSRRAGRPSAASRPGSGSRRSRG